MPPKPERGVRRAPGPSLCPAGGTATHRGANPEAPRGRAGPTPAPDVDTGSWCNLEARSPCKREAGFESPRVHSGDAFRPRFLAEQAEGCASPPAGVRLSLAPTSPPGFLGTAV